MFNNVQVPAHDTYVSVLFGLSSLFVLQNKILVEFEPSVDTRKEESTKSDNRKLFALRPISSFEPFFPDFMGREVLLLTIADIARTTWIGLDSAILER